MKGILTEEEQALARMTLSEALSCGASAARVCLGKTIQHTKSYLDASLDKVLSSTDRSIALHVFKSGSYACFSTNRLSDKSLMEFVRRSVATTALLPPDPARALPEQSTKFDGVTAGNEMGLCDEKWGCVAEPVSVMPSEPGLVSLETEYSDSFEDALFLDSDGFEGRQTETSYGFCAEATVQDSKGLKYSGYWWEGTSHSDEFHPQDVERKAASIAAGQIGPKAIRGGDFNIVVDCRCSSRLVGPLISAMDGNALLAGNSFLCGKKGVKMFSSGLSVVDEPVAPGRPGSRLFDSEGVALKNEFLVKDGVVNMFFLNSYCARRLAMAPTCEGPSRVCLKPFVPQGCIPSVDGVLRYLESGLLITGFNGGNCNPLTGDFSFGVEGFAFGGGVVLHPVREAVMTGNLIDLFSRLEAVLSDARSCTRWQIPTLAFRDVKINV